MPIRLKDTIHKTRGVLRSLVHAAQVGVATVQKPLKRSRAAASQNNELLHSRVLQALHTISTLSASGTSYTAVLHSAVAEISHALGFPIVTIELYDAARQTLVLASAIGLSPSLGNKPSEASVARTYSAIAIQTQQAVITTDGLVDPPPYAGYDILHQPSIHTFVCIPLLINNQAIGTLSLGHADVVSITAVEVQWLTCLATSLALQINNYQTEQRLQDREEKLRLSGIAVSGNIYDWDIPTGRITRSHGMVNILGFSPSEADPTPEWWLNRIHPDDQLQDANFLNTEQFEIEYRIRNRADQYVAVLDRGLVLRDDAGNPTRVIGYVIDISQRKQITEERDRFFALSTDLICIAGLDGTFRQISPASEAILGYTPDEMVGRNCREFIHPVDQGTTHQRLDNLTSNKGNGPEQHRCENRYRCKDGTYRWLEWSASVIPDQDLIFSIGRDVTEQKRSQAQIRERDARLRSIFEQSTLGMAYASEHGLVLEANQPFCNFVGYSINELRSLTFCELTYPEDRWIANDAIEQLRTGAVSVVKETRYVHKEGTVVWGKVTLSAIREACGVVRSVAIILEDITARKAADAALAVSQKRYESLVHSINGIVWEYDLVTLRFSFVSDKAEQILGYPVSQWKAEPEFWENHIHPEDRVWVVPSCRRSTENCEDHHFEYRMIAADGRVVWFEDVVSVVVEHGKPVRLQGILINIGDRKQIEAERQRTEELLAQQLQREQLLTEVTQHIRQSLELTTILATAVNDIRYTLQADRVLIYHLGPERIGQVIQESVREGLTSVLRHAWPEGCLTDSCYAFYLQGRPHIVVDVDAEPWESPLTEYSRAMGVRSQITAPILQAGEGGDIKIWGLLVLHSCAEQRNWHPADVDLLQHIADQLAIGIQQSELYHQLQQANQNLEYLATHDKLTQIANRRFFEDSCQREWSRLTRERSPLSLVMADLDYFKQYNDTYGHPAGDECLLRVAQAIQAALKRPGDLVARYGGEEFVIVLPNTDIVGAIAVVQDIQDNVRSLAIPHLYSPVSHYITLSLGIATVIPQTDLTLDHLIAAADAGLYEAKARGRNGFVVAPPVTPEMLPLRQPRSSIEQCF